MAPAISAGEIQFLDGIPDIDRHQPPALLRKRAYFSHALSMEPAGGEIVEVRGGGHIVRSMGRKDRHSKVCTAKGPRDRRVRLSAHTAIQFYDVQDRLGYDRPSKAVDWLIRKAKAAIDELTRLPAWQPAAASDSILNFEAEEQNDDQRQHLGLNSTAQSVSFLPPSLHCDAIANTTKSLLPVSAPAEASSSAMEFQIFSGNYTNTQDLSLSLHTFQDPVSLHHHSAAALPGFDGWTEHHHQQMTELARLQKLPPWYLTGDSTGNATAPGYHLLNFPAAVRAWMDPPSTVQLNQSHNHFYHQYPSALTNHESHLGISEFSGFRVPARIQGDHEEHHGYAEKPSSASFDSPH